MANAANKKRSKKKKAAKSVKQIVREVKKSAKQSFERQEKEWNLPQRIIGDNVYVHSFNRNFLRTLQEDNVESILYESYKSIASKQNNRINKEIIPAIKPTDNDRLILKYFKQDEYAKVLNDFKSNLIKIDETYRAFLTEYLGGDFSITGNKDSKEFVVTILGETKTFTDRRAAADWCAMKIQSVGKSIPLPENILSNQFQDYLNRQGSNVK